VPKTPDNVTPIGVNRDTGELVDMESTPKKRRRVRREIRFVMIEVESARNLRLTGKEWEMFWEFAAATDRENGQARIRTAELAKRLEMIPQNVSRMLRKLKDRNVILEEGLSVWRINPRLLTRGSVERWQVDIDAAPGIQWRP
jgi:hypothetical protein